MKQLLLHSLLWSLSFSYHLFAAETSSQPWPQWRGPNRDGHAPSTAIVPKTLPSDPERVWRINVGDGLASPVVASGKVIYFDNQAGQETLHAVSALDAREHWRVEMDEAMQDEQGPPGPRCTPVVDDDRVYAQSSRGKLACFALEDSHTLWLVSFQKDFGASFLGEDSKVPGAAEHGYTAAPVIEGDRLIACVGGTNGAGIVCFEKRTGRVLWKSQADLAAYAAPIVATLAGIKHAICFTVEGLVGLDLDDGRVLWRWPLKTSYGRNVTTPVIADNWVIVGSYQAGLAGVKIGSDGPALKVDQVWTNKTAAMNFSSPVIVGRDLYGLGPAKNVICADVVTGKIKWSKEGYFNTAPNMAYASFLVLGENILMTTDGGLAALIATDATACRELGRAQVCGMNWCSPAYAEGRLYIRDGLKTGGHLYCLNLLP